MNNVARLPNRVRLLVLFGAVLAVALAHTTAVPSLADSDLARDDFELGALNEGLGWLSSWQLQGDVTATTADGPSQGSWHMRLAGEEASASRAADVTASPDVQLGFDARLHAGEDGDPAAQLVISKDGGGPTVVHTWAASDFDGAYRSYQFDLDAMGITPANDLTVTFEVVAGDLFVDEVVIGSVPPFPPIATPSVQGEITLDGSFEDWTGHAFLADPYGDSTSSSRRDLHQFYWANNPDEEINYHMIKRHTTDGGDGDGEEDEEDEGEEDDEGDGENGQDQSVEYILYVDTNNNGSFGNSADRKVQVTYQPQAGDSKVRVRVRGGSNNGLISDSGWVDWGESREEGGQRVEFAVTWQSLGISLGDVIRMYAISYTRGLGNPNVQDRLPDGTADIQWSPASIFGPWLLGGVFALGVGTVWFLRGRHVWRRG
ncbi:MAG: hypothetical protein WD208_00165 [Dehalococcoidia bacterium]